MDQAGAVGELRVIAQDKPHCLAAVEHTAAPADDAIDQLHAFADLRGFLAIGVDRQVL